MKLTIPMTANLASVEVMASSSSRGTKSGNTKEVSMQAPIAAAKGASSVNTALQHHLLLRDSDRVSLSLRGLKKLELPVFGLTLSPIPP